MSLVCMSGRHAPVSCICGTACQCVSGLLVRLGHPLDTTACSQPASHRTSHHTRPEGTMSGCSTGVRLDLEALLVRRGLVLGPLASLHTACFVIFPWNLFDRDKNTASTDKRNRLGLLPDRQPTRLITIVIDPTTVRADCLEFLEQPHHHVRHLGLDHLLPETTPRPRPEGHEEISPPCWGSYYHIIMRAPRACRVTNVANKSTILALAFFGRGTCGGNGAVGCCWV